MIAFRKDEPEDYNDPLKKLQLILNELYEHDFNHLLEDDEDSLEEGNLSELLEIVYFHLFTENYSNINLSIVKNPNNSLRIKINKLE